MTTVPLVHPMPRRPSIPGYGQTLSSATEQRARSVRECVEILRVDLLSTTSDAPTWLSLIGGGQSNVPISRDLAAGLAAWWLASVRLVAVLAGRVSDRSGLPEAEAWFRGPTETRCLSELISASSLSAAEDLLRAVEHDDAFRDLLPYVLEAHGPGSRASVMRDPATMRAREAKRATGVYYTPSDVAEYIVAEALRLHGGRPDQLSYFDPACGSGVFLRAAFDLVTRRGDLPAVEATRFVTERLFGSDIDPLAIQGACFVLLERLFTHTERFEPAPFSVWSCIRRNFVVSDSLRLFVPGAATARLPTVGLFDATPSTPRESEAAGAARIGQGEAEEGMELGNLLPAIAEGADIIVGNPPYAPLGQRRDGAGLKDRFASYTEAPSADCYPLFVEMMWRFARRGHSAAGMVVPLSIAYHSREQLRACRKAIVASGGRWRFAFFDREPHALFGEDVKTRNAIVFRQEAADGSCLGEPAVVETGPMRKWSSRTRAGLFRAIDFTPLECPRIADGIPKLGGAIASHAFELLQRSPHHFSSIPRQVGSLAPAAAVAAWDGHRVLVGGTAYNFLNVFRPYPGPATTKAPWSESSLHCFEFGNETDAHFGLAILCSRVSFWLWHVEQDGFHVTREFLTTLPFGRASFHDRQRQELASLGSQMWAALQSDPVVNVNGGRQTVAFRPYKCDKLRDAIDAVLLASAGLDSQFLRYLQQFVRSVINADMTDIRGQTAASGTVTEDADT